MCVPLQVGLFLWKWKASYISSKQKRYFNQYTHPLKNNSTNTQEVVTFSGGILQVTSLSSWPLSTLEPLPSSAVERSSQSWKLLSPLAVIVIVLSIWMSGFAVARILKLSRRKDSAIRSVPGTGQANNNIWLFAFSTYSPAELVWTVSDWLRIRSKFALREGETTQSARIKSREEVWESPWNLNYSLHASLLHFS